MKKKAYITPDLLVVNVAPQLMQTMSGGGSQSGDPTTGGQDDSSGTETNRSRSSSWDDED